jgi:hypothetical protein
MRTNISFWLCSLIFALVICSSHAEAATIDKKKPAGNNGEQQREYQEAVNALKDKIFLVSLYSFVDKIGNVSGIEPEGNFITVNNDRFTMQKSAALVLSTFAGSNQIKGQLTEFRFKENKKGIIQFSFVISEGDKVLVFKAKMDKGNNTIEGSLLGKKEEREISVSGNVQPVKSHFDY